jgi:hypothetical protein
MFFIRRPAAEPETGRFETNGSAVESLAHGATDGLDELPGSFGPAYVVAWASAPDSNDTSGFIAHEGRGARLTPIHAQEQSH